MKKGKALMNYLKIDKDNAYFKTKDKDWTAIDQIGKEDLLDLLNIAIEEEDFAMDEYDETKLNNKAHRVIYENIYAKLSELIDERDSFRETSNSLFKDAFEKYELKEKEK